MIRGVTRVLTAGVMLLMAATGAKAAVFYNNANNPLGNAPLSIGGNAGGSVYASFTVTGSQIDLTDVVLALGGGSGNSQLVVSIHNTNPGSPPTPGGAVQFAQILDSAVSTAGLYDFHSKAGILLNPGQYWVQVADTDGVSWYGGNNNSLINATTSGEYWTMANTPGTATSNSAGSGYAMQMCVGTDVGSCGVTLQATFGAPEPASLAILGMAVVGLGLVRRRRLHT